MIHDMIKPGQYVINKQGVIGLVISYGDGGSEQTYVVDAGDIFLREWLVSEVKQYNEIY